MNDKVEDMSNSIYIKRWSTWAVDTGERALKTLLQTLALFAVGAVTDLATSLEASPGDYLPGELIVLVPVVMAGLSVLTSWLSKHSGKANTAAAFD